MTAKRSYRLLCPIARALVLDYKPRHGEAVAALADGVRSGQLTAQEHILDGAEAARGAIAMLYAGQNTGKLLIRVDSAASMLDVSRRWSGCAPRSSSTRHR